MNLSFKAEMNCTAYMSIKVDADRYNQTGSRVVPLSLFASVFPWWSSIVCLLIHYITSFVILHIFTRHKLQDIIIPAFGYSIAFFKVHYPWKKNTLDNNYVDDGLRKSFIVYHSVKIENIDFTQFKFVIIFLTIID